MFLLSFINNTWGSIKLYCIVLYTIHSLAYENIFVYLSVLRMILPSGPIFTCGTGKEALWLDDSPSTTSAFGVSTLLLIAEGLDLGSFFLLPQQRSSSYNPNTKISEDLFNSQNLIIYSSLLNTVYTYTYICKVNCPFNNHLVNCT